MYSLREIDSTYWDGIWNNCNNVNLLQSWQYGEAKQIVENWVAHRYLVINDFGVKTALLQVLIKKIPVFGVIARVNRGPIVVNSLEEKEQERIALKSISALINEFKIRGWRMLQVAPQINNSDNVITQLKSLGLRKLSAPPMMSGLLNLESSQEELLMGLNGKWRNCLRKGLKSDILINNYVINGIKSSDKNILGNILDNYNRMKLKKKFSGISVSLVEAMALQNGDNWKINLFVGNEMESGESEDPIGTVLSICFGDTSIYLIGTTNSIGRKLNTNYVLLWQAILKAKKDGCRWFDIGGLNSTTPKGIAHFKKGLNAVPYELIGEWRFFNFFWMK